MRRISIALLTVALVVPATTALASKPLDEAPPVEAGHKITICHATSSGQTRNYWRIITVDVASSGGRQKLRGHVRHTEHAKRAGRLDVIPAFSYGGIGFAGRTDPGNDEHWAMFLALRPAGLACLGESGGEEGPPPS
jgi:hypothetical protein